MLTSNKKGVSLIVSYVLLIVIGISIAGLVYSWLEFYVSPGQELNCDDGTSLIIKDYDYSCVNNYINITLQNKGRFTIDGYIIRVNDKVNSSFGIYVIGENATSLKPGYSISTNLSSANDIQGNNINGQLTLIEVQPYKIDKGTKVLCSSIAKQKLSC